MSCAGRTVTLFMAIFLASVTLKFLVIPAGASVVGGHSTLPARRLIVLGVGKIPGA